MSMGSVPNRAEDKKTGDKNTADKKPADKKVSDKRASDKKTADKRSDDKKKKAVAAARALSEKTGLGKHGEGLLFACMIALFVSMCGIIFMFTKAFFHSDSAFYVQLAVEQMKSGKLFPEGMCYSTVLFVRSPNLILIPILKILQHHFPEKLPNEHHLRRPRSRCNSHYHQISRNARPQCCC